MRCVFAGTGAFLGRVESETRCAFWPDEPTQHGFDPSLLISVDLSRTPSAAADGAIPWDAVELDDAYTGAAGDLQGNSLGLRWPELQLYGALFLEQSFVRQLPEAIRPACPPKLLGGRPYEHTTVLYWPHVDDPRAGRRYAGHQAEILDERGTLVRVAVYMRGASDRPASRPARVWIDLADPEQCDGGPDSMTTIGVGTGAKTGALFLPLGTIPPQSDAAV
jgi:hypothetical protein